MTDKDFMVKHRLMDLTGMRIFYREAGSPGSPAVLLLHGFPSSSHQFRFLIPAIADRFHVFAPDFPAFGFSSCPALSEYEYTFEHYTDTIEAFAQTLGIDRYGLYVHDYGAQVGFRLAVRSPDKVRALVIQNSEAYYPDGRSPSWAVTEEYWRDPKPRKREELRNYLFTQEGIRREFLEDLPRGIQELIDPGTITLAWTQINRPGVTDALLDLHLDYRSNVELYPRFQTYFRKHQPPVLVIWGKEDQYYSPAAAIAYKRDLPNAEVQVIDGGHWALESHGPEIIHLTRRFFNECYAVESVAA